MANKQPMRLRGISGDVKGKLWESDSLLRAGRLGTLEIVLDDSSVSRRHAEVRNVDNGWWGKDDDPLVEDEDDTPDFSGPRKQRVIPYVTDTRNCLVIDPDECIDCTLCEPECPVKAIYPEDDVPAGQEGYIALNAELCKEWPVITVRIDAPADAAEWDGKPGKLSELKR